MECIDNQQHNNLFKDKTSDGNTPIQHPEQGANDSEGEDGSAVSVAEEALCKTNDSESKVKDMDEESVDDTDELLSTRKRSMIILSDDEESNPLSASVTSRPMQSEKSFGQRNMKVIDSDSESDEDHSLFNKKSDGVKSKVIYNRDIFDTELSDEDQPVQNPNQSPSTFQEGDREVPQENKKKVKKSGPSNIKAQQELREIRSESQRFVRESRISLPYHRPKQRTLAEFLARRKETMPPKPPKSEEQSVKATMRNMEILKLLEEKKKQVEEFYKSDSDSEDADDQDWIPGKSDVLQSGEKELNSSANTGKPISDVDPQDLVTSCKESSTQEIESQEGCPESLTLTNHSLLTSEDEGIGASEKNSFSEPSPSDISLSEDHKGTDHDEISSPLIKLMKSKHENVEKEGIETDVSTEFLGNSEETLSDEAPNAMRKHCFESDVSNSNSMFKFTTPKLRLLASKLPEEELNRILSVTPKLNAGKKEDFIDLSEGPSPSRESGLKELKNRFLRHAHTEQKLAEKQQLNLNIVSKEDDGNGGECLVSSVLSVTVNPKEDKVRGEALTGSRFTSIKAALQAKIRQKRELNRLKRVQEKQFMETEELPEVSDNQNDDLPNEEVELTDQSETDYETESEPEENDVIITDKKRKKNVYMDDEAEEDEEEEGDLGPENDDLEETRSLPSDIENENDQLEATKERKRIIENSDSEEEVNENFTLNLAGTQDLECDGHLGATSRSNTDDLSISLICEKGEIVDKDTSTASFDSSFELYGSVIAGHQPRRGMKNLPLKKSGSFSSSFNSISTKPQELMLPAEPEGSVDMFNNEATSASPEGPDLNFSSLDCTLPPHEPSKEGEQFPKLDLDFSRIDASQDQDELIGLCTGQFSDQREEPSQTNELYDDQVSSTQEMNELLGLCTGHFSGLKGQVKNTQSAPKTLPISQDEHDDDEILGFCTSKFPTSTESMKRACKEETEAEKSVNVNETDTSPKMIIYSSEDDDSTEIKSRTIKRKKRKRTLEFSDDEDAQEPLAFDDEENEMAPIVFTGFKDNSKGGIRAEFLEKEAELSGSDVNSDDEGEDSFDDMEEEEGDKEHFDSNELRDQVGKAHLKSLLDSDKREVRLLQEMYLEDGELHGEGRSRQFRWKNLDKRFDDDERKTFSDEEFASDEDMDNSQWRKEKMEREKFIQEQKSKIGEVEVEAELYEVNSWSGVQKEDLGKRKPLTPIPPPKGKAESNILFKKQRGSFLNRDKSTLARIAEFTRDRRDVVGGAKQGGNFVFQQLGGDELKEEEENEGKVTVSQRRRDTLQPIKKAKIDHFSVSRDDSQSSSSIFEFL